MNANIDLTPEQLKIIAKILATHLTKDSHVWIFGSRATGTAKKFSDIDLLIDVGTPLSLTLLTKLSVSFDESMLPYKVDIADLHAITDTFKMNIKSQLIPISF